MRPNRKSAGEVRFRISKADEKAIDYLMFGSLGSERPYESVSAMMRSLIHTEYQRRLKEHGSKEKSR